MEKSFEGLMERCLVKIVGGRPRTRTADALGRQDNEIVLEDFCLYSNLKDLPKVEHHRA